MLLGQFGAFFQRFTIGIIQLFKSPTIKLFDFVNYKIMKSIH